MHMIHVGAGRFLWVAVLTALAGWATWGLAAESDKEDKPRQDKPAKTYEFSKMSKKPWNHVIDWLADEMGLPFVGSVRPTGTLEFKAPRGKTKFSLPEIIDILNEAMVAQKYYLIRRPSSFTIVAADETIDPVLLPRVRLEDLPKRGKTELVSVVLPLQSLVAEDFAPEVKKMMGPFGQVVPMAKSNQLVLQDTVGNLLRIQKTTAEAEKNEKLQAFSYKCEYIKARDAASTLEKFLGDPRELLRAAQPPPVFGRGPQPQPQQPAVKVRMHYITFDERTNTVFVNGPADKIGQAKTILEKLDMAPKGQQKIAVGPPQLQTYNVAPSNAEAVAKTLQGIFKTSSTLTISSVGSHTIMVWACPADQMDIKKHLEGIRTRSEAKTQLIRLNHLDAGKMVETLKGMFPDSKTGNPYLEADTTRNGIIVKGTPEQISEVNDILKDLGEGGQKGGNLRIISLDKGSGTTLAEALMRMLPQLLNNPIKVIKTGEGRKPAPKEEEDRDEKKDEKDEARARQGEKRSLVWRGVGRNRHLVRVEDKKDRLIERRKGEQDKKDKKVKKHGKADMPLTITAFGNRLLIKCDDPDALATVQELTRLLTQTTAGEGDFEVIRLRHAGATEVAKVLDEAFNGTKAQNPQQQGNPFFGGGRFGRQVSVPNPAENRIRVVADPELNALVVRANPLDMMTITRLLDNYLDSGKTDSKAIIKTWKPIRLKHAIATDVADVIKDVYRQSIDNNPKDGQQAAGGFRGFLAARLGNTQNRNVDANGNPRGVSLSVAVDNRTNSLVVSCNELMYKDIKTLVENLEEAASKSRRTVRVIKVDGMDPVLLQQLLEAIQGRRITTTGTGLGTGLGIIPSGIPALRGPMTPERGTSPRGRGGPSSRGQ